MDDPCDDWFDLSRYGYATGGYITAQGIDVLARSIDRICTWDAYAKRIVSITATIPVEEFGVRNNKRTHPVSPKRRRP